MEFKTIHGQVKRVKNVKKRIIDWSAPSKSKRQREVKKFLKKYWENQVVYEEFPVYGTRMKVDILNATKKIAIEVQGSQHSQFNKFFHNNSRSKYLQSIKRDYQKAQWLEKNGYTLIEIEEKDINKLSYSYFSEQFNINI